MQNACKILRLCKYSTDISIMQENSKDISIIKSRILQYLDYKGISMYKCYADTGISRGVLGQPNGLSEENLLRFIDKYQDISTIWLLRGIGDMIVVSNESELNETNIESSPVEITEITPDFLLKRFEELVIENNAMKANEVILLDRIKNLEGAKTYDLQQKSDLKVAESE